MPTKDFNTANGKTALMSPDDMEFFFGIPFGTDISIKGSGQPGKAAFMSPDEAIARGINPEDTIIPVTPKTEVPKNGAIPSPFGPDHEAFMNEQLNKRGEKTEAPKGGRKFFAGCLKRFT